MHPRDGQDVGNPSREKSSFTASEIPSLSPVRMR
jgi:hypothetical protein